MKKFLAIVLVGYMLSSLVACGADVNVSDANDNTSEQINANCSTTLNEMGVVDCKGDNSYFTPSTDDYIYLSGDNSSEDCQHTLLISFDNKGKAVQFVHKIYSKDSEANYSGENYVLEENAWYKTLTAEEIGNALYDSKWSDKFSVLYNLSKGEAYYRYWNIIKNKPRDDAKAIVKDFLENGNTKNSMPWTENLLSPDGIDLTNNISGIFDELFNSVSSLTELTSMQMRFTTEKVAKGISVVGLGVALTQLGLDLYNSKGNDSTAAANLYKNIFSSSGSLFTYMTGYGSLPFSVAFLGVAVVSFGLDYGVQTAEEYKEKVNKNIFDQYFKDYAKFDEKHWYKLFVDAYWDEWQNGTASVEGIEAAYKTVLDAIEGYSEEFWKDVFREGSDALTFAVAEAGKTNYYTPTEDQKAMYVEEFKRYMNIRFKEKVIPWIERFLLEQQQDALYASLYKLCEPFNEYYRVQVQEIAPIDSGDTCKYQEHTIRFGNESGFTLIDIPDTWTLNAPQDDDQWAVTSEFTCLSYLLAGAPDRIMLFPKDSDETDPKDAVLTQKFDWYTGDDIFEDDPALTQEFNATEKVTVISLGQMRKDFEYYLVERYDLDPRRLYYDGYGYEIMAVKRDMQSNRLTEHLIRGIDAEVEQDSYREYSYDSSTGLLTMSDGLEYSELKPNSDWTNISGHRSSPEFLPGKWGMEEEKTGKMLYKYIRYLAVNQLSPGKWQVDETGETIEYVLNSFDASDQQSKRLESPSGRSFLEEARSFATEMGIEMYDGQGYD